MPALYPEQKAAIKAIVSIFETSKLSTDPSAYGVVTLLTGDSGGLTYGKHQTTLNSGNLYLLIKAYCDDPDSDFAPMFSPYLDRLASRDQSLNRDMEFRRLLQRAATDADMRRIQDAFFDRVFWNPSNAEADNLGATSALGVAVIYDSFIHGSWSRIRNLTNQNSGSLRTIGEVAWITAYNEARFRWLSTHPNTLLRATTYRQNSFRDMIRADMWELALPFRVRGVQVSLETLNLNTGVCDGRTCVSAESEEDAVLIPTTPAAQGNGVMAVQAALNALGWSLVVDGQYGPRTAEAVRQFQAQKGLTADGIVGPATRAALGL